jgi:hypothetical protein
MSRMTLGAAVPLLGVWLLLAVVPLGTEEARGTPTYAARAGRTCDNCHLDPSFWENPELKERKCTLACIACHVDPAGGGMRNVGGRFYGASTLPLVATQERPTRDWDRTWLGLFPRPDTRTTYSDQLSRGPSSPADQDSAAYAASDTWAKGTPYGGRGTYSFTQGRYGTLRADPLFRVGWDVRAGMLVSQRTLVFPMQVDLGMALQPVESITLLANLGARGRSGGLEPTFDDPGTPYLRDAFVLVHELPYQLHAKAGRFVPSFGLRLDDHTAFIRRGIGLDTSVPESRVLGVEIGAAPNYPFFQASAFRSKAFETAPDPFDLLDVDDSWGSALNLGYRNLGWSIGGSLMYRDWSDDGWSTQWTYGVYGAVNPWFWWPGVPLTYQVEYDQAARDRIGVDGTALTRVFWQELSWAASNGINVLLGHSFEDPDTDIAFDEANRLHTGLQITPYTGVTLDLRGRVLFPRTGGVGGDDGSEPGADLFFQIHLWN